MLGGYHADVTSTLELTVCDLRIGEPVSRPTVLSNCAPDMLIFREETFGPVAPLRVVPDFATAVAVAPQDRYGLSAAVLTVVHWSPPGPRA